MSNEVRKLLDGSWIETKQWYKDIVKKQQELLNTHITLSTYPNGRIKDTLYYEVDSGTLIEKIGTFPDVEPMGGINYGRAQEMSHETIKEQQHLLEIASLNKKTS